MKKAILFILAAAILFFAAGCKDDVVYSASDNMNVVVYGIVYDGLASSLAGTEKPQVYYSYDGRRRNASYDSNMKTYSFTIPDYVESVIITSSLTGYHDFYAEVPVPDLAPIVPDEAASAASSIIGGGSSASKSGVDVFVSDIAYRRADICLYPTSAVTDAYTINMTDATSNMLSALAGSYSATITALATRDRYGYDADNSYIGVSTSGALAAGTATLAAASLVYDATYTVEVYGVAGYLNGNANLTLSTLTGTKLVSIALNSLTDSVPTVIKRNDRDEYGYFAIGTNPGNSNVSLVLTFDKNIELDQATEFAARITSITTVDVDDDTVGNTLIGFTGDPDAVTPVASNHLTVAATDNVLTITTVNGYLTVQDLEDDLSILLNLGTIYIREAGTARDFVSLDTVLPAGLNSTTVIVRDSTTQE